jgi:hypothetical protein
MSGGAKKGQWRFATAPTLKSTPFASGNKHLEGAMRNKELVFNPMTTDGQDRVRSCWGELGHLNDKRNPSKGSCTQHLPCCAGASERSPKMFFEDLQQKARETELKSNPKGDCTIDTLVRDSGQDSGA